MPDGICRDSRRARFAPARHLARHANAAVVLAAVAIGCGEGPDAPSPGGGDLAPFVYTATDVPVGIPNNDPTGVTSYLSVSGAPTSISKVTVQLSMSHSYADELYVSLYSPSGSQVALSWNNGGSGANYTNTVFDDAASTSIVDGYAPFRGAYRPQWPLSIVDGENANGTWRLKVWDGWPYDAGVLQSWSIQIW